MAGTFVSGMEWTIKKLSSLVSSATPASSSSTTPSEGQMTALEDLKRLERTMKRIKALLMEVHERDIMDHSEKYRLEELKEVAYDAEDVVGDYEYDVLHAKTEARDKMLGFDGSIHEQKRIPFKVIDLDSVKVSVPVSDKIARKVKTIRERFEEISGDWETLRLSESDAPRRKKIDTFARPPTSSLLQESTIHGRDEDKENVIKQLLSEDGKVSVVAIVGMGGIGKTTLAQLVYNDARVCEHFELKGWVCVSENFDVVVLTERIIESFTKRSCKLSELNNLQCELKEIIKGKRFFLVLDDVWNENPTLWDSLHIPLRSAKSGIVLVTARNSTVAESAQAKSCYNLHHLESQACWSLFKQLVFDDNEKDADEHLMGIAKKIVEKCCGLPLAVKTTGSFLRYEHDIEIWTDILKSKELGSNTRNGDFLPILKLSYYHMPSHLKKCFEFFALFPKDYYYVEAKIIELWMYVGIILPSNSKKVEDIGRAYIKNLQERSMITRPQTSLHGEQQGFVIHDLLHDLAQEVARFELRRWEPKVESDRHNAITEIPGQLTTKVRYLSIVMDPKSEVHMKHFPAFTNQMRLVVAHVQEKSERSDRKPRVRIHNDVYQHMKNLRALDLSYTRTRYLTRSVGNLKQLRYLNLSHTSIEFLPDSVCNLYNLETLELTGCLICKLPDGIRKLSKLRHLNCNVHTCGMPYGIGLLTNLQSLSLFAVGTNYSECDICELKNLLYLSASLTIKNLRKVTNMNHAKEASLQEKQYLQDLTLDFNAGNRINGRDCECEEQLLETLEPHPNIERLVIKGYRESKFPQWVGDSSFSKLVRVELLEFSSELLPALVQLPSLKSLHIEKALNIRTLNVSISDFPMLAMLVIKDCRELESLVDLRSQISLKSLKIYACPKLHLNAAKEFPPSLEAYQIQDCGCDDIYYKNYHS